MLRPKFKKSASRRSSILKTPAVQQPLQHVQANVSLYQESSITIKQKRRVSFADKKHIKEFCDSAEQGTVWDITYEESSSENSGQINLNNQSYTAINNHNINEDRITSENVNIMNMSLDLTEPISTLGPSKSMCIEEASIKESGPILCQVVDKTKDNDNILIESNVNIDICADKRIVVYNDTSSLSDTDNAELNKTCVQDVSMEITEIPYIIKSRDILPIIHKQLLEDKENIPMSNIINKSSIEQLEFTECLQSIIKPAELQGRLSKVTSVTNDEETINTKTQIFQDVSMEMTCVIPLIDKKDFIDQTLIFHDGPMDNTMVVTSTTNKKEIENPIDISDVESNKTKLLNSSMQITNTICSLPCSKTVDATIDAMDILNYEHSSIYHNKNTQSNDDTMEFTIAATNLPPITELNKVTILGQTRLSSESTKIFQNESMAITEPLHILKIVHNNDIQQVNDTSTNSFLNNEDVMSSKTQIFQNESMAITEPLHILKIVPNNGIHQGNDTSTNSLVNNEDVMSSKTQIFQNESMAITESLHMPKIVPNNGIHQRNDTSTNSLVNNEDVMSSKTQIFQNESMAITEPFHILKVVHNNDIQPVNDEPINLFRDNEDITSLNTRIFQNMSMEITNVITNLPILPNLSKLSENTEEDSFNSIINRKQNEPIVNNTDVNGIENVTTDSSTTDYIEDFDNNSTELKPANALTSLISSFVYADMIEDDSFVKAINENELQSMKDNIERETICQQNNINTNSAVDDVNVNMENIQSFDKCIVGNKQIIREHESYIEYSHENNIREENIIINREKNNECNPKLFLSESVEINGDIFEKSISHKIICDISRENEMVRQNKQLVKTKKDIQENSATYIIQPEKNSVMDSNKHKDDRSSYNQISGRLSLLPPTLHSASSKSKMPITENNLIANLTGNNNLNDIYEEDNCNTSSLNENVEHITSHEKPENSNTFPSLVHQLKMYMNRNDCIWDLYHENIDKQMLVISFISTSLLIVIFTQNDVSAVTCPIKHIDIISRLENDENVQLSIAHKLIKEKINGKYVNQLYKYNEGFVPLLNDISEDVKLILDFIFDLKQLDNLNLMEINTESITFIVRSKYMNIILEVRMDVKLFDKIDSTNINIVCILGTIRKEDIKELIINIKRDYKFLRRFMSDIKRYIDIIEQANLANVKSCN